MRYAWGERLVLFFGEKFPEPSIVVVVAGHLLIMNYKEVTRMIGNIEGPTGFDCYAFFMITFVVAIAIH